MAQMIIKRCEEQKQVAIKHEAKVCTEARHFALKKGHE